MRWLMKGPLLLLLLLLVGPPAAAAATNASDASVLRALRDTILSLAELRDDPPAAFAAAVANPACCDRAQVLQREQCPLVITCSIIGWTMNMTPDPCAWEGVGCSEGGRVTQLTLQFDPPEPPLRLSSAFVDLVARLPALEVLEVLEEAAFDRPTQLPASWAGLTRLRRLFVNQLGGNKLTGCLPPHLPAALQALEELDVSLNRLTGTLPPSWASLSLDTT
ncbi:hypothetical protein CHLNCDRAFT_145501 [Chlorella variabilis]|uniref:Leucine-rich repeat-containing N-terminal plant-type domain-containing protein n=1 Tax=Chlorella variabilis TaxID=554065 RepID=E1ZDM4_CHLVA|nr:hypothetical protein CHLNCDRAFT_145501 [Chlorella variabilis]EFN55884.1 hypothetical protein CHLNCDRAFT_145501 [Chlorella variabilis]|eukprot:XP_005847986.1 hypothetical protein CHLNCDRAFT_145501 [Chlorella variabilis]